jgi:hypothetical protein
VKCAAIQRPSSPEGLPPSLEGTWLKKWILLLAPIAKLCFERVGVKLFSLLNDFF